MVENICRTHSFAASMCINVVHFVETGQASPCGYWYIGNAALTGYKSQVGASHGLSPVGTLGKIYKKLYLPRNLCTAVLCEMFAELIITAAHLVSQMSSYQPVQLPNSLSNRLLAKYYSLLPLFQVF